MAKSITTTFSDLPKISATVAPLMPHVRQCTIHLGRAELVCMLLLPDGMFAPYPQPPRELPPDDVLVALGRIIATHGAAAQGTANPEDAMAVVRGVQAGAMRLPSWPDPPGVVCTHALVDEHLAHYGVLAGDGAASLHVVGNQAMPVGWAVCSPAAPPRMLLIALGRMLRIASPNFLTGCLIWDLTGRRRYGMLQWCRQAWSLPRTRANSLPQEATMPPASVR